MVQFENSTNPKYYIYGKLVKNPENPNLGLIIHSVYFKDYDSSKITCLSDRVSIIYLVIII